MDSHYGLVAPEASGKVEKEKLNILRAAMMDNAAKEVSNMDKHHLQERLRDIQKKELLRHKMEAREKQQRPIMSDEYSVHCKKCDQFVTCSSDLRVYESSHYTSIRKGLDQVYEIREHPRPVKLSEFEKIGKVHCKRCGLDWGMMAKFICQDMPLLKPQGFIFIDSDGKRSIISKWKKFKYTIPEMDVNEMFPRLSNA
jgi:hypothetical protein